MGVAWDVLDEPTYETGISKAVLYQSGVIGVAWNGLISVDEVVEGADLTPIYIDGQLRYNKPSSRAFRATLKAFSAPDAFSRCFGERDVVPGVTLTGQNKDKFGLSYQTNVGSNHKKIHIIYGCTATAMGLEANTIDSSTEPEIREWRIDAVPPSSTTYQPTAHLIVDSSKIPDYIFQGVENALYGTDTTHPTLFNQAYLRNLIGNPLIEPLAEPV